MCFFVLGGLNDIFEIYICHVYLFHKMIKIKQDLHKDVDKYCSVAQRKPAAYLSLKSSLFKTQNIIDYIDYKDYLYLI